jgi:hypothetical protein
MKLRAIFATLTLGAYFVAPQIYADCGSTYTSATTACSTAQQNTDNAAWNTYVATEQNDWNTYNTTVSQDAITQANTQSGCLSAYYVLTGNPNVFNDVGTCGAAVVAADTTADNTYSQTITACGANEQCICKAGPARDYTKAAALAVGTKCANDAANTYNQCVANSSVTQNQNDTLAYAAYIIGAGTAQANYDKTVTLSDSFTVALCNDQAWTAYANCLDDADCSKIPADCCADGCAKTLQSATLNAYTAFVNSYGPAAAQYAYDNDMCYYTQQHDDNVSYAQWIYATGTANATYNYNQTLAWNLYQYTTSIDADAQTRDVALCSCTSTTQTQYDSCVATANATKTASDNNALAAYNQKANVPPANPTGDNWNTWNSAITIANNTLQAAYATHLLTQQTCVQNTQNTVMAAYNSANTAYNNAVNAANQAYSNCLKGCSHG